MRKIILSLITIGLWSFAVAQNEPASSFHDNVIPPSPEASKLGEFGAVPMNYNIGSPNISIPIYTIQGTEVSLPISLNYDAKGIKVEEIAGSTGLGWSLSAGGAIVRTVRGKPDDATNGYFDSYPYWLTVKDIVYNSNNFTDPDKFVKFAFERDVAGGAKDLQPDQFAFNFAGYSGKIYMKYDATASGSFKFLPVVSPAQDLQVKVPENWGTTGTNNYWEIVTPDGIIYRFEAKEKINSQRTDIGIFVSAWYLSAITSPSGEQITFGYENATSGYKQYEDFKITTATLRRRNLPSQTPCIMPGFDHPTTDLPDLVQPIRLKTIVYNQNTAKSNSNDLSVNFTYNTLTYDRCDLPANYINLDPLVHIGVQHLGTPYSFHLEYSNFGSPCGSNIETEKRMRLKSVSDSRSGVYGLTYNESSLPELGAMSDHWGYYNGAANNGTFIPSLTPDLEATYENMGQASANRETNEIFALRGLLSKIEYPTGGHTEFQFEAHHYPHLEDNYKLEHTVTAKAYGNSSQHGTMNTLELHIRNLWDDGDTEAKIPNVRVSDTINITSNDPLTITSVLVDPNGGLFRAPNTTRIYKLPITDINVFAASASNSTVTTTLTPGTYVAVAAVDEQLQLVTAQIIVDYTEVLDDYLVEDVIGGARLKKMTDHDGLTTNNDIVTEYFYFKDYIDYLKNPLQTTPVSSMALHYMPEYFETNSCDGLVVSAYDQAPFGRIDGHHVGYSEVAVVRSGLENGVTIHKFVNTANPDFRSQPTTEKYYDSEYNTLYEKNYYYESFYYPEAVTAHKFKVSASESFGLSDWYYEFEDRLSLINANYASSWRPLTRVEEITYGSDGTALTSTTNLDYYTEGYSLKDQVYYQLMEEIRKTTSDGRDLVSQFTFPPELAVSGNVYDDMVEDNNYNHLVKREVFIDNGSSMLQIDGTNYGFSKIGSSYRVTSESIFRRGTAQTFHPNRTMAYTPSGRRLEEISMVDGNTTSTILWDDNEVNPIAQFVNASFNEVSYTGFEDGQFDDWLITGNIVNESIAGEKAVDLENGGMVRLDRTLDNGDYIVRVIGKGGNIQSNTYIGAMSFGNDWEVKEVLYTKSSASSLQLNGTAIIDEVRVYPANQEVQFKSLYVKDYVGITSESDDNLSVLVYEYNSDGRLIAIKDKDKNYLKAFYYNFKN